MQNTYHDHTYQDPTYRVQGENGVLEARLVEGSGREIMLTYRGSRGDTTTITIKNGWSTSVKGRYAHGIVTDEGTGGYLLGLTRLGPELRAQIPLEWVTVLGNWLASPDVNKPQSKKN